MKSLLVIHAATSLLLALVLYILISPAAAIAFSAGTGLSFFNLVTLVVVWPRILAKKLVALSVGIIVIKFAILAWILYEVATKNLVHLGWFAAGLAVVIFTVIAASMTNHQVSVPENETLETRN